MKKNFAKKALAALAGVAVVATLAGCTNAAPKQEKTTINVYAAASMTESLQNITDKFMEEHPDIDIKLNFDSSGTLAKQIQQGADADIFIAAGQKAMNSIDNKDGKDFVAPDTRFNILQNHVVLVVPSGNPKHVESFENLAEDLKAGGNFKFAMGNSDVPVGQYTEKILKYFHLDEQKLAQEGVITYGSNVKEVAEQVRSGAVDAGVVYSTDAYSQKLDKVAVATKEMCGEALYPIAIMKDSKHMKQDEEFIKFLKGKYASEQFEKVGFVPLAQEK